MTREALRGLFCVQAPSATLSNMLGMGPSLTYVNLVTRYLQDEIGLDPNQAKAHGYKLAHQTYALAAGEGLQEASRARAAIQAQDDALQRAESRAVSYWSALHFYALCGEEFDGGMRAREALRPQNPSGARSGPSN